MEGNFRPYNHVKGSARIANILDQPAGQFEEAEALPNRKKVSYTNGFYSWCTAIFVDIRDSSGLASHYKKPRLAKLYRAFISEMVAVLNSDPSVREVNIVGDCVWATYDTPKITDVNSVFDVASRANTLNKLLNAQLAKRDYQSLRIGIGVDYGRILMIKAGHKGSKLNDVIYMGDVVNASSHLADRAGKDGWPPILIGPSFQCNLNDDNKELLTERHDPAIGSIHTGDIVLTSMNKWIANTFS